MPRPLRIEYAGAWYHVMNRGINRMKIFIKDDHREEFLKLLEEISNLFKIEIHGYCMMDNHYHLLLRTPFPNLGKAMRHLNGVYTQKFNRSTKRDGALFRGRYKAILIEEENYLLKVSRYIHLNPIEADMVERLEDFKWSSYRCYLKMHYEQWLQTTKILSFFANEKDYAEFITEGIDQETIDFYKKSKPIIAKQKFIDDKIANLSISYQCATSTDIKKTIKSLDIERLCNLIANYFDVGVSDLKISHCNKRNFPRMLAMLAAKQYTLLTHQKIAEYFSGVAPRSLSQILRRCRQIINSNDQVKKQYEEIKREIEMLFAVDL